MFLSFSRVPLPPKPYTPTPMYGTPCWPAAGPSQDCCVSLSNTKLKAPGRVSSSVVSQNVKRQHDHTYSSIPKNNETILYMCVYVCIHIYMHINICIYIYCMCIYIHIFKCRSDCQAPGRVSSAKSGEVSKRSVVDPSCVTGVQGHLTYNKTQFPRTLPQV